MRAERTDRKCVSGLLSRKGPGNVKEEKSFGKLISGSFPEVRSKIGGWRKKNNVRQQGVNASSADGCRRRLH